MTKVVLDANIAIDWFCPSIEGAQYSEKLIPLVNSGSVTFVVPLHFDIESTAYLVKKHRSKPAQFTEQWLKAAALTLDVIPIQITAQGINHQLLIDLAIAYNLSVYDTPYFHLARTLEIPIATRDKGLISACKAWNVLHWKP